MSCFELGVGPEVRVDLGEVRDPVAVVPGRLGPRLALDGLVLEGRRHPDGRRAEALDVVEAVDDPLQVAAVVEALAGRVEAVLEPGARDRRGVVAGVAVLEAVGHDEVEVLAREVLAQAVTRELPVGGREPTSGLGRADGDVVRLVVVGEAQRRGLVDRQGDVAVGEAEGGVAVVLAPGPVEPHLVQVVVRLRRVAGRDGERPGEEARRTRDRREVGLRARVRPVGVTTQLAHEGAHEGDACGEVRVVRSSRRGGDHDGSGGERDPGQDGIQTAWTGHRCSSASPGRRPSSGTCTEAGR